MTGEVSLPLALAEGAVWAVGVVAASWFFHRLFAHRRGPAEAEGAARRPTGAGLRPAGTSELRVPRHLALVTVVVDSYAPAIDFYVRRLGFDLREDTPLGDGKRWVVVAPPGAATGLLLAEAADRGQRERVGDQTGGRVALFLHTDDFARDHARLLAAGVAFEEEPRYEPYGTVAVFRDLYGNRWDLLEPAPRR
ncbi:VOC family protein [Streptomyces lonarensis]|uniref:VOC family protein n=1 Tax=Streptomyces lonarensis TaxID=700599 RepID=A0A7X6CWX8_9ACTN|nr:VOC family protein [Streptomyces lonarensis]